MKMNAEYYRDLFICRSNWIKMFLFFTAGAALLSFFSLLQKISIGYSLNLNGFYIPVILGGLTGIIIGIEFGRLKYCTEALKNTHLLLDSIVDSMPSILIAVNSAGRITYWNSTAEKITGIKPDKFKQMHIRDILTNLKIKPDSILEKIKSGKVEKWTVKTEKTASDLISETIIIYPLKTSKENGAVLLISDTTKEYKLEKQLEHSRKMDVIGQLAEGVAHDFNNMLGVIIGSAELLQSSEQEIDKENQELIELILKSSGTAANLASKLLSLGKKNETEFQSIDINELLMESADILKRTIDPGITVSITDKAESSKIKGDYSALQSAIINLGINSFHSIKASGKISISTENIYLDEYEADKSIFNIQPGRYIKIIFSDTGRGIPEGIIENIFDPFFTTKIKEKGTGLGLTAVYETTINHHGIIEVESTQGEGTSFFIYIPCAS